MIVQRRAVTVAWAGGLIAVVAILLLRHLVTHERTTGAAEPPPRSGVAQLSASAGQPLHEDERTVPMRERADAIARAQVWREPDMAIDRVSFADDAAHASRVECRFRFSNLGGTTPKFNCLLPSGKTLRIKYGTGAEVPAEVASTRLLRALGFAADTVTVVERLRCHGCPDEPFVVSKVVEFTRVQPFYERVATDDDYEDFEWVGVEQKFAARPIEGEMQKGWAFFELDSVDPSKGGAPRAHVDGLRLLAVFLAHWDNKSENQRLVCLSERWPQGTPCPEPFLLLQDVGSTFGPRRVNLQGWESSPMWADRAACKLSMDSLPYGGGTFGPVRVSERGRRFLAGLLEQLTDAQLTDLFTAARFDKPRSTWADTSPVADWVRVFKQRVRAISDGPPCPDASSTGR